MEGFQARGVALGEGGGVGGAGQGEGRGRVRRDLDVFDAKDFGGFGGGGVGLVRAERGHAGPEVVHFAGAGFAGEGAAGVAEVALSCGDHDCDERFAGGALDHAAAGAGAEEGAGEGQHVDEPVEDDGFELRDGGRALPVEGGGGEGRGVELAEHGGVGGVGGEEGHEVWGLPVGWWLVGHS